jgi:hypothetical protein
VNPSRSSPSLRRSSIGINQSPFSIFPLTFDAATLLGDFERRPSPRLFVVNTEQNVKVVVHDAKTAYGHCKYLIEFFESLIDPIFPVVGSVI